MPNSCLTKENLPFCKHDAKFCSRVCHTVGCGKTEQYVMAFHQIYGSSPSADIFLYNPNSVSVKYNITTPLILLGGMKLVNQVLNSNAGTSVPVLPLLLLDGDGSDANRGNAQEISLRYNCSISHFVPFVRQQVQ